MPRVTADEPLVYEPLKQDGDDQISRSPWGVDDQIGRLNWVCDEMNQEVLGALNGRHVFDLAVDLFIGMPVYSGANDPQFDITMVRTPSGGVNELSGDTGLDHLRRLVTDHPYTGDRISMYTHSGTHMDTLNHFGQCGCFWNGWNEAEHLGSRHWLVGGPEHFPPIFARGVLLDIAGLHGVDCLPESYPIEPEDLKSAARDQGVELKRGDVVIIRTGKMADWGDPKAYETNWPGITLPSAKHLCAEVGAMCIGSDNMGMEVFPGQDNAKLLPVHGYALGAAGTPLIEIMNLEELAAEKVYEFGFIAAPIKLRGATAAPTRPIAVTMGSR
jgi:kynurenine formamidase